MAANCIALLASEVLPAAAARDCGGGEKVQDMLVSTLRRLNVIIYHVRNWEWEENTDLFYGDWAEWVEAVNAL